MCNIMCVISCFTCQWYTISMYDSHNTNSDDTPPA